MTGEASGDRGGKIDELLGEVEGIIMGWKNIEMPAVKIS